MVLCDRCDAGWHLDCLSPPLASVPEGEWLCPDCPPARQGGAAGTNPTGVNSSQRKPTARRRTPYPMLSRSVNRIRAKAQAVAAARAARSGRAHPFSSPSHCLKRNRTPVSRFKFRTQPCTGRAGSPEPAYAFSSPSHFLKRNRTPVSRFKFSASLYAGRAITESSPEPSPEPSSESCSPADGPRRNRTPVSRFKFSALHELAREV